MLAGRYEISRELGRGPAGTTYLARDARTGLDVIAKLLSLDQVSDWKAVELFEREAEVLKGLRHERIPACVDSFRADVGGSPRFVLVRQYVEGKDLHEKVAGGWRATEAQIRGIGRQLVDIVSYIHSLRPPVIHRDINPRNIVMREDGAVFLVDFGGVQDAIRFSGAAASTMVGTPGYVPMEQFVGRATVRSDLYGLAATLLFLLTRRSPADLPSKNLKPDLDVVADLASPGLARVLSAWLEPDEAARTLTPAQADRLLSDEGLAQDAPGALVPARPPSGSRIVHEVEGGAHRWVLPLGRASGGRRLGGFGIVWLGFVAFWTWSALQMKAPVAFVLFAVPFVAVGVGLVWRSLASVIGKLELRVGPGGLSWFRRVLFASRRRTVALDEAGDCREEGAYYRRARTAYREGRVLCLEAGAHTVRFGEGLSNREREWLRDSINEALRKSRLEA